MMMSSDGDEVGFYHVTIVNKVERSVRALDFGLDLERFYIRFDLNFGTLGLY